MKLTRRHKVNAIAAALWNVKIGGRGVMPVASDILEELDTMGYTVIKRKEGDGTANFTRALKRRTPRRDQTPQQPGPPTLKLVHGGLQSDSGIGERTRKEG